MSKKQTEALNMIIAALPENCRESFREVAEYAISLGYTPTLKGTHKTYVDFSKSKVNRTILKIDANPKFPPRLAMKFYALPTYSGIFKDAIDEGISVWNKHGYEARCFGCGQCDGTHGYTAIFPNGKQRFMCGRGVFDLPSFSTENISEVKAALKAQDEFYMKQIAE